MQRLGTTDSERMTRRAWLRSTALAGAAALGPAVHAGPTSAAAPSGRPGGGAPGRVVFFDDPDVNLQTLFAFGSAAYGAAEFGEVMTAVQRVQGAAAQGAAYQAFYDAFWDLGTRIGRRADEALGRERRVTARGAYLRSAEYLSQCLFFVLGTAEPTRAHERRVYRAMQERWDQAARLFSPPFKRVAIPYEGTTLPGYLLSPLPTGRRRPLVILNNGSDAQNVDLYVYGAAAALERGYHALIFEGPGQGAMLFERSIPFRPDWERVVTPVVDFARGRPDVDPARIAIVGWSFSGELVARAAAFEHRLSAVALDPGVLDASVTWRFPPEWLALAAQGRRDELNAEWRGWVGGLSPRQRFVIAKRGQIYTAAIAAPPDDGFALIRAIQRFRAGDVVDRIAAPTLVMDNELEEAFPGQPMRLYESLRAPKRYVRFTIAEGAQYHDQPMAPQVRNGVLFDWLDETLRV